MKEKPHSTMESPKSIIGFSKNTMTPPIIIGRQPAGSFPKKTASPPSTRQIQPIHTIAIRIHLMANKTPYVTPPTAKRNKIEETKANNSNKMEKPTLRYGSLLNIHNLFIPLLSNCPPKLLKRSCFLCAHR